MINRVTLIGHCGGDAELKTTSTGKSFARFSLATTENYKDATGNWQKVTEWHSCTAWNDLAARVSEIAKKGALLYVEGKVTYREYEKDGTKLKATEIQVNTIRSMERKPAVETYNHSGEPMPAQSAAPVAPVSAPAPMTADDLPF